MVRFISLLLFIGLAWGQADLDKLVVKDGTTYLGEYSKTEGKIVYFKPQGAFAFQPIPVKRIERLELKDGFIVFSDKVKNNLTLEEYQKLSTKEKAIYDEENYGVSEKFSYPESLANEYDKLYYKQVYYNKKRERRGKAFCTTVVITGILFYIFYLNFDLDLDFGSGDCGTGCGGNIDVVYP